MARRLNYSGTGPLLSSLRIIHVSTCACTRPISCYHVELKDAFIARVYAILRYDADLSMRATGRRQKFNKHTLENASPLRKLSFTVIMGRRRWRVPAKRGFNAPAEWKPKPRGPVARSQDNAIYQRSFLRTAAKIADEYERSRGRGIEREKKKKGIRPAGCCARSAFFRLVSVYRRFRLANYRRRDIYGSVGGRILENWPEIRLCNNYVTWNGDTVQWSEYLIFDHCPTKIVNVSIASAIIDETRRKLVITIIIIIQ